MNLTCIKVFLSSDVLSFSCLLARHQGLHACSQSAPLHFFGSPRGHFICCFCRDGNREPPLSTSHMRSGDLCGSQIKTRLAGARDSQMLQTRRQVSVRWPRGGTSWIQRHVTTLCCPRWKRCSLTVSPLEVHHHLKCQCSPPNHAE